MQSQLRLCVFRRTVRTALPRLPRAAKGSEGRTRSNDSSLTWAKDNAHCPWRQVACCSKPPSLQNLTAIRFIMIRSWFDHDWWSKLHLVEGEHGFPRRVTTGTTGTTATRFQVSRLEPLAFLLLGATSVCGSSWCLSLSTIWIVYGWICNHWSDLNWFSECWLHCFMVHESWFVYRLKLSKPNAARLQQFLCVKRSGQKKWDKSQEQKQGCSFFSSWAHNHSWTPSLSLHKKKSPNKEEKFFEPAQSSAF